MSLKVPHPRPQLALGSKLFPPTIKMAVGTPFVPEDGGKSRLRLRSQVSQGRNLSGKLQKLGRLPGGGIAGQEQEELGMGKVIL